MASPIFVTSPNSPFYCSLWSRGDTDNVANIGYQSGLQAFVGREMVVDAMQYFSRTEIRRLKRMETGTCFILAARFIKQRNMNEVAKVRRNQRRIRPTITK